ncbi:MAG: alpha/beta hydrolase, partial [Clostridia bacterium]|nr:alpha/beta hydrolase [Clostridia bacterium]
MKAKKIGKIILRVLLVIFILFVVFIIGVFVFHQIKRNEEMDMLKIKGYYNPVSVGDHNINVAKFGNPNGKHTIVAMAGLGSGDY